MSGSAGAVEFDTLDPAKLAGMSMEELAAEPPVTAEAPAADARPEEQQKGEDKQEKSEGEQKPVVEGATPGAAKSEEKDESDKERNFAVLRARERRQAEELAEAQRKNEELQRQLDEAKAGKAATEAANLAEIDQRIADYRQKATELAESAPAIAADYQAAADDLAKMRGTMDRVEQERKAEQEREQKRVENDVKDHVEAAIEATPVLKHWREHDPKAFDLAADQDAILRTLPEWADKPLEERFAKAVELAKVLKPDAVMPAAAQSAPPPQGDKKQEEKPKEKPAADKAGAPPLASLSDLPGGLMPAKDEAERVGEMSQTAYANWFNSLTREQQDAHLASLG